MTEQIAADALICGAGAAGLTLAIDLARRGISFRLIEKKVDPFGGSRGKRIQPRTQEVSEHLGILDRVVAAGGVYPKQRAYRADGSYTDSDVVADEAATPAEPYHLPLRVPQFLSEAVMRERPLEPGHRPVFGCELHAFGELDDEGGHFRETYALTEVGWVLIRPDGYVGAIVSSEEIAALETCLRSVGLGLVSGDVS